MQTRPEMERLRVASYNIRKAKGLDGKRDPMRILRVLNSLNADVIALQEADLRLGHRPAAIAHDMIETETDFEIVPLARNGVSLGWHGNAMLVRRGTRVRATHQIDLPGIEPRGAVRVDLESGTSIVGTHLGLARSSRRQQLARIASQLGDTNRAIILGDMNEWRTERGLEALRHGYTVHAPGRTFHAARPVAALDRIALSPAFTLRDAGVSQGPLARQASDHLPIWADLSAQAA